MKTKFKTKPKWKIKCFECKTPLNKYPEYYKFYSGAFCLDCGGLIEAENAYEEAVSQMIEATCVVCDAPISKGRKYCNYHAIY